MKRGLEFFYKVGTISVHNNLVVQHDTCNLPESQCGTPTLANISWPRVMPQKHWEIAWNSTPSGPRQAADTYSKGRAYLNNLTIHTIGADWTYFQRPVLYR